MPKIVTRQTRIAESRAHAAELAAQIAGAVAADSDPNVTDAERAAAWGLVAESAGAIQRRTRQLAGLGRGG